MVRNINWRRDAAEGKSRHRQRFQCWLSGEPLNFDFRTQMATFAGKCEISEFAHPAGRDTNWQLYVLIQLLPSVYRLSTSRLGPSIWCMRAPIAPKARSLPDWESWSDILRIASFVIFRFSRVLRSTYKYCAIIFWSCKTSRECEPVIRPVSHSNPTWRFSSRHHPYVQRTLSTHRVSYLS